MTHAFDRTYWEDHWSRAAAREHIPAVNPHLAAETAHLTVGSALDAGCGAGTESVWLAERGWRVTAADISATALATAAERAAAADVQGRIEWVETDLARWDPTRRWDLIVTAYAHPDIGQHALYRRLAHWVAPGGTLLIIAHDHGSHGHPESATAALEEVTSLFPSPAWRVATNDVRPRMVDAGGHELVLRDLVVRAQRNA